MVSLMSFMAFSFGIISVPVIHKRYFMYKSPGLLHVKEILFGKIWLYIRLIISSIRLIRFSHENEGNLVNADVSDNAVGWMKCKSNAARAIVSFMSWCYIFFKIVDVTVVQRIVYLE